jgi:large subunit ribosomal protein L29
MSPEDRNERLNDLHIQVIKFRSKVVSGGTIESPGQIREIKRTIARINTINHEEKIKAKEE